MVGNLHFAPEVEAKLSADAQARGVAPEILVVEMVTKWAHNQEPVLTATEKWAEERRAAAFAGLGMFAGQLPSVDEFLADKHAEAQVEAEKDAQRMRWRDGNE